MKITAKVEKFTKTPSQTVKIIKAQESTYYELNIYQTSETKSDGGDKREGKRRRRGMRKEEEEKGKNGDEVRKYGGTMNCDRKTRIQACCKSSTLKRGGIIRGSSNENESPLALSVFVYSHFSLIIKKRLKVTCKKRSHFWLGWMSHLCRS